MRGTIDEVLEWLTYHREYAPLMQMSRQRLVGLRWRLNQGSLSEEYKEQLLERLKNRIDALESVNICPNSNLPSSPRKVRDAYILPAIVRDHHGRFFTELALIKMAERDKKMHDLNLGWVCGAMKRGGYPSKEVVREVLNRKGWNMFEERMKLPSVWEV